MALPDKIATQSAPRTKEYPYPQGIGGGPTPLSLLWEARSAGRPNPALGTKIAARGAPTANRESVDPVLVGGPLRGATGPDSTSEGRGAERPSHDETTQHPNPIPNRTP